MGELELRPLLTPVEVAEKLNLRDKGGNPSEQKALRLIREGRLPKVPNMGRLVRVDPAVLERIFFSGKDKIKK